LKLGLNYFMAPLFFYERTPLEKIACNLCGGYDFKVLSQKGQGGLPLRTVICVNCGLIFINPRMTREGYDDYYKYHYRDHRSAVIGKTDRAATLQVNFYDARKFGRGLAKVVLPYIRDLGLMVDVGSSTGGVLFGMREIVPSIRIMGIEPSLKESDFARSKGVPTRTLLFEDFIENDTDVRNVSGVLCVRSLNHLLDPAAFFRWSRRVLKDSGALILVVKNFRHQVRRAGSISAGVQIDHPYMFTPETLRKMVEQAGFEVVYLDSDEHKKKDELERQKDAGFSVHHIRLVARKTEVARKSFSRLSYWGLRWQFWPPFLKIYYLFKYSRRFRFLKRFYDSWMPF